MLGACVCACTENEREQNRQRRECHKDLYFASSCKGYMTDMTVQVLLFPHFCRFEFFRNKNVEINKVKSSMWAIQRLYWATKFSPRLLFSTPELTLCAAFSLISPQILRQTEKECVAERWECVDSLRYLFLVWKSPIT